MTHATAAVTRVRRAVRKYGLAGASREAVRVLRRSATRRRTPDPFDERYGTDTARQVRLEGLVVRGGNREYGVHYQPSEPDKVRQTLQDLDADLEAATFVDIGSGKGRVVLVASTLPFARVVGVEFSEELDLIARENLRRFPAAEQRAGAVDLLCMDAVEFEFPATPLVLYLYNPFREPVMEAVLANLRDSLTARPRPCVVILEGDQSLSGHISGAGFREVAAGVYAATR